MRVVMTTTKKGQFHHGLNIIRDVDDNIENENDNDKIKDKLNKDLGTQTDPEDFKLWAMRIIDTPSEPNKTRLENFIMGYLSGFDRFDHENNGEDHSVYFKWDGPLVRVFVSPLSTSWVEPVSPEKAPRESLIHDGAAASDPPTTTTPPPPLQ